MKQAVVTIKYDEEKLNAVKQYMGKKDADFDAELKEVLGKVYDIVVPLSVRHYIESRGCAACNQKGKPPAGQKQCGIRQCCGE